jgi:hypothetical protein
MPVFHRRQPGETLFCTLCGSLEPASFVLGHGIGVGACASCVAELVLALQTLSVADLEAAQGVGR